MACRYACRRCLLAIRGPLVLSSRSSKPSKPLRPSDNFRKAFSTARRLSQQPPEHDMNYRDYRANPYEDVSNVRQGNPILRQDNLFHPFSKSPTLAIRQKATYIKQHAYCPHHSHNQTRMPAYGPDDPEAQKPRMGGMMPAHARFECPDCGIPLYCSEEHWLDDYENHIPYCEILRQINEDEHDLRSGRFFGEFEYPGPQLDDSFLVNLTNWDTLLWSRGFNAINGDRNQRQVTRMLTYPATIGSVLHELSPYSLKNGGRVTVEGLRSFSALRYTLHPPLDGAGPTVKTIKVQPPPVRIFILGARAESSLPRNIWVQLAYIFPRATFHLIFIGPESMMNREKEYPMPDRTPRNPFGGKIEGRVSEGGEMKITTYVEYYQTMHKTGYFAPFDPYFDCFVLFHPGLGHPASEHDWADAVPMMLETKVPIICTGYTEYDMERDLKWVHDKMKGEFDVLLEPGENRFRSLRWDLNDLDPIDVSAANWGIWAFRGKRYEATRKDADADQSGVIQL